MTRRITLSILAAIVAMSAAARDPRVTKALATADSLMMGMQSMLDVYDSTPQQRADALDVMTDIYELYTQIGIYTDYIEFDAHNSPTAEASRMARQMLSVDAKDEALQLFELAATRGDVQCMNMAGVLLFDKARFEDAAQWWRKAILTKQAIAYPPAVHNYAAINAAFAIAEIKDATDTSAEANAARDASVKEKLNTVKLLYDSYMRTLESIFPASPEPIKSGYSTAEYIILDNNYTPRRLYLHSHDIISGDHLKNLMRGLAQLIVNSPGSTPATKSTAQSILTAYPQTKSSPRP